MNEFQKSILKVEKDGLFRELKYSHSYTADFTSNSYLNLHKNKQVIKKSIEYIKKYGTSFTVSPLVGKCELYEELFSILEKIYKKRILIFPSGYQLNSTVIPSILSVFDNPIVFFDKFNHASMNHGLLLSKKQFHRYQNCDLNHLELLLKKYHNSGRQMFVFTESIFSMDGTIIDIENLLYLKQKYNFFLYIDEAHSIGIYGDNGYGISYKYKDQINVIMGTFSKAIGSQGSFIAVNNDLLNHLVNRCNGLIYSTGLSPANIGASCEAFNILPKLNKERSEILEKVTYMNDKLNLTNKTHIIPIIFHSIQEAQNAHNDLKKQKINVSLIRYPTVPKDAPRLRLCINNEHTIDNISLLFDCLK